MIRGTTRLIAHLGVPTESFKAPMIYNPWFESRGIDAVVVPMGSKPEDFPELLRRLFRLTNIAGALITMPHKTNVVSLLGRATKTVKVAGACNAVRPGPDGALEGDMFDGEGFVRGVLRKGRALKGASALVIGAGGVGSAIAASLAASGVGELALFDPAAASMEGLAGRLRAEYPALRVRTGSKDPAGFDVVVNATPLGMKDGDPLPADVSRIAPTTFVGEVVMKTEVTPFLAAARERGCATQVGADMLFEQIPAYLEFFGYPTTTPEELRSVARIAY
ncbi:MAG: ThiF family adenylyltransferase [Hyphomicrobiales bacterium]|nr:ThiF family adenylyltransferase [Hyphomicrobiales bacterium]MDE2016321.1 ThiF family adenylyltransferase [Hyphomicrobiales bacterium]